MRILAIALCGALGAVSRYGASVLLARYYPERNAFPLSTLLINVVGSFLLGVLVTLVAQKNLNESWRFALGVGFLGAFTTFSTFSVEVEEMMRRGDWRGATLYVGCSVVLGIVAVFIGRAFALRFVA